MRALATALLGLLLALASVVLHSRTNGTDTASLSGIWSRHARRRTREPAKASDAAAAAVGGDGTGTGELDRRPHRGLFGRGGGGGGGGNDAEPRRARLAFLILSSGDDLGKLELLLPEIYHPDNVYLVHVDAKTPPEQVCTPSATSRPGS